MAPDLLPLRSEHLAADIAVAGAELRNLRDGEGRSLQWDGDPAIWSGHAPILFPIVGALAGGRYRLDGRTYELPRHGFARRSTFDVVSHDGDRAVLRLDADDATRAVWPFEFRLELAYALVDAEVRVVATVANRGDRPMPASLGFHPAFRWPLPYGRPREDHAIRFDHPEPAPVRRLDADGLLRPDALPTPVVGDTLALRDDLFDDDALILDRLDSRRVTYGATTGPRIAVRFDGMPTLGIWSKPGGAGFVCIEPWQGTADPAGSDGDLHDKPGMVVIAPGASRDFAMTIALVDG